MVYALVATVIVGVFVAIEIWHRRRALIDRKREQSHRRIVQNAAWDGVLVRNALKRHPLFGDETRID